MGDIPPSIGEALWPASRFLGYRPARVQKGEKEDDASSRGRMLPQSMHDDPKYAGPSRRLARFREHPWTQKASNLFLTFIGSFFGVALCATMARSAPFLRRSAPVLIGAFGAEATLLYAAPTSPLTQPRNVVLGNTISAVIGVALTKGFLRIDGFVVGTVGTANWAAAALAISISIAVMQLFNITHPPGGATAVLAITIPQIANLSWFYVGDIAASSVIMLAWAMLINNIGHRRYPTFWISPALAAKVSPKPS